VPEKDRGGFPPRLSLLFPEGHAVGALVLGGIALVGTHLDALQRTVIIGVAVIGALLDGAGDALVCIVVHRGSSFPDFKPSMSASEKTILERTSNVAIFLECGMMVLKY